MYSGRGKNAVISWLAIIVVPVLIVKLIRIGMVD